MIQSEGWEIISNVYKYMKDEARNNAVTMPLTITRKISARFICKISSKLENNFERQFYNS